MIQAVIPTEKHLTVIKHERRKRTESETTDRTETEKAAERRTEVQKGERGVAKIKMTEEIGAEVVNVTMKDTANHHNIIITTRN